jgi:outer membrane protein assembly factor BamB
MIGQNLTRKLGLVLAAVAWLGLAACSSTTIKPAQLETLNSKIAGRVVWTAKAGGWHFSLPYFSSEESFPLSILARDDRFVVAGVDGVVKALQASDGQVIWQGDVGQKIAAGVGSDGRFAAVVTRNSELVVLDAGKIVWRKPLAVPTQTTPLVAGERVFVYTVDRAVLAFDAIDGRRLWELRRPGEPLTLSQPGALAAYKDTLIVGQGPRLAGVDPLRGSLRWEANVASPRGTNEVERLADVVGPLFRQGDVLCARAFQSAVGCVDAERGISTWTRNVGGIQGVGGDAANVYAGDASDRITAWKLGTGDVVWVAEQFLNRKLSAPLSVGTTVVVGDSEGYVHFLDRETGKTQLRLSTDGSPIVSPPVALGTTVLVVTRKGGLFALRPE